MEIIGPVVTILLTAIGISWGINSFLLNRINGVDDKIDRHDDSIREDIAEVRYDLRNIDNRINSIINNTSDELRAEIAEVRYNLKIANSRINNIIDKNLLTKD